MVGYVRVRKKIIYVSGTRADYGLMRGVLGAINKDPGFSLTVAATGMHLMPRFGNTIDEIEADGLPVRRVNVVQQKDDYVSMSSFVGRCTVRFTTLFNQVQPDAVLLLGDRGEMLAGAVACTYLAIPIIHIHGGEITSTVDEHVRHAITKLAHIHFPATKKSAERIIRMGEDPAAVHIVGAPGLDAILKGQYTPAAAIGKRYNLDLSRPVILVVQHPVTEEADEAPQQIRETCEALRNLSFQTIIGFPNADAGSRKMIRVIQQYRHLPFIRIYPSLPHQDYLGLMRVASVLVGNSSSGIIEAPSFHLPVVNIGTRQQGRERSINIIDAAYDRGSITMAINKALFDTDFIKKVRLCKNPYGEGKSVRKILSILKKTNFSHIMTQKTLYYS